MKYKAIIWDCDGVLIDSEVLACGVAVEILAEIGYSIPLDKYLNQFMGQSSAQMFAQIEQETGLKLAEIFPVERLKEKQKAVFNLHLQAISGVENVLKTVNLPMAVASGSESERLQHTLSITNLIGYFNTHVYSVELVKNGKPAPDIFLYAAEKLKVVPENCLVIEDSLHGVNAAKAAGMDVFAYVGGSHMTPNLQQNLTDAGVQAVLRHMDELPALLY
jgi:HAD superfamily hydrolase (TIGR01509 family)